MQDGKHCPECGEDIGFWPVFSAGISLRIRCPHCGSILTYSNCWNVILVLICIVNLLIFLALVLTDAFKSWSRLTVSFIVVLLTWKAVELVIAKYLRANNSLSLVDTETANDA
ncbi:MAG: hypothetical protein JWP89_6747 [Schlesneria sp.]|nr:hypothetical protein [Schlesneria sp.]